MAKAFKALARKLGDGRTPEEIADGFIRIAVANMANAIKTVSVQRGYDVAEYVMNSFGGAGGQHACLVADALGIKSVLLHPLSGVLSAYGMGLASLRATRTQAVLARLDEAGLAALAEIRAPLEAEVREELVRQGIAREDVKVTAQAHLRYEGTDSALPIPAGSLHGMRARFEIAHQQRFGFISPEKDIEIEAVEVEGVGGGALVEEQDVSADAEASPPEPHTTADVFTHGRWHAAPVLLRADLAPGNRIEGPALIIEDHQTVMVEPEWQAEVTAKNHLLLTRTAKKTEAKVGRKADPVMLEVFNNLFVSVAEQMGYALQNTARSVNIKERLDFSCAIFDERGRLIANAPHIPVHLGSMDKSVETILREVGDTLKPGDVWMLNAPYNGGTHLPDITVVTPVFAENSPDLLFFVAARGHHADIGGIAPGSMSPMARSIEEEGVYIDPFQLVEKGRFREDAVRALLTEAPYPVRNPRAEHRRSQSAGRRQREGRDRAAQDGAPLRASHSEGLYGPCAGQRRGSGARGDRQAQELPLRGRDRSGKRHQGRHHHRQDKPRRRPSISPARARRPTPRSTRPSPSRGPACSTCSARWSTRTSRSTPAACGISRSSCPRVRC